MFETTITTRRAANGLHRLAHVHSTPAVRLHCSVHRTAWQIRAARRLARPTGPRCANCGHNPCALTCFPTHETVSRNLLASAEARLAAYATRLLRQRASTVSFQGSSLMTSSDLTAALSTLWSFGSHDVR